MGYTTTFDGEFKITPPLTESLINVMKKFAQDRHGGNCEVHPGMPGFWCQWVPSDDGKYLYWDGGEKFYDYVAWLNLIIKKFLIPNERTLNGEVGWEGEESTDVGIIVVKNNKIFIREARPLEYGDAIPFEVDK